MAFIVSRHAQRRMKLYNIDVTAIENMVNAADQEPGQHEIVDSLVGYAYPIKVVYVVEGGDLTLITAFPLKRRLKS